MNTLGKTVTLHKGLVVTDIGPHPTANRVRICITDNGERHLILDRRHSRTACNLQAGKST